MIRFILAATMIFCGFARAESLKDTTPNVSVVGEASEEIAPDRAVLHFGVITERPTAAAASSDNAKAIEAILSQLETMGVAKADVQTQGVFLSPISTEDRDAKGKAKTVQAYRASNSLAVFVKPAEKAGDVIGAVIDKGANSVDGVDYDNSDLTAKRDALRAAAVKDAERRARVYAEAAGLRLGRVVEIRPFDEAAPRPMSEARVAMARDAFSAPLRPGLQRVTERVSVTWALAR
ncbi:SIMPL domain-containing protein [Methylocystis sp. Sn-Cys]|uniref:SIMPL domain-containing protein n=1 Tax=Methylocystis sp. Sn-Cys TaxID=1701263 RepID=UPI00192375B6|nr:SIMPL domain-containing protein [Methylocystis sp. Sn-Cys]MBL1258425.1 SIMPL domain-containing protein [Methylocystis sp. Sn-Cys]